MRRIAGSDLLQAAKRYGDRPALVDGERVFSYWELDERSNALANQLVKRDCDPGSRMAIWLANSHEVVEAFVAAEKAGLVRVSIDPGESPGGVEKILAATRPSVLIASTPLLRGLDSSAWLPITIAVGDATAEGTEPYEQVIARGATGAPNVEVDDEDLYQIYIRMVAGGKDLSVRPTYANWRREVYRNMLLYLGGWYGDPVRDDDIFLNVQQLMHGTAVLGFYPLHLLGCPTVLLERFDAEQTLAAIEQHHITTSFMVPGMVERIQQRAAGGQFDISSLKRVLYGGAPMSRDALTAAIDTLGDVLVQVYGRYDGAWPITILDQQAHRRMRDGAGELWGSCGRWAPFVEARLAGPNLEPIAQGEKGEVVVRGDGVVPAARAEDGWCHTTDLAVQDSLGYLHIVGRTDEMINTGSYHVYPGEIEEVLTSHPAVRAVSVIGVPDARWGETVKACVVVTEGYTGDSELERDLIAHCKAHLPGYKAPKSVDFLDKNERSAEGTLNRERLRSRYALRGVVTGHNTSR